MLDISDLEMLVREFLGVLSTIEARHRSAKSAMKRELENLDRRHKQLEGMAEDDRKVFGMSFNVFHFRDPENGSLIPYDVKQTDLKEAVKLMYVDANRQAQWHLVEAYEAFEDFAISVYTRIRRGAIEFRPSFDKNAELTRLQLKNKAGSVINVFKNTLDELKNFETINVIGVNFRLILVLIEKMRHVIVHRRGQVDDIEGLFERILKGACLYSDGARGPIAKRSIEGYLGKGDYQGLIVLLEQPMFKVGGLEAKIDRLDNLLSALSTYAVALCRCLTRHFSTGPEVGTSR
ncbi:hypothetical protein [Burkholderia seminalis]|uniref:hypothetical protein n=1 Tax=Burkholderia seminalis TaxID=488731 RepID=UPI0019056290|nr:hypothetical protein [Burkholderia seminalis]MBJ9594793.1 hypothetical protein [Burkholderia seminalis]